jgi:hypothetical protein
VDEKVDFLVEKPSFGRVQANAQCRSPGGDVPREGTGPEESINWRE